MAIRKRKRTDEEILAVIARVAQGLGVRSLSINQFRRAMSAMNAATNSAKSPAGSASSKRGTGGLDGLATGLDASTVKKRFGSWNRAMALAGLVPNAPHKRLRADHLGGVYRKCRARPRHTSSPSAQRSAPGGLALGCPLEHEAMLFEPTSESGVILLFGALAAHLGFRVLKLDRGFPDMIAWRRMPETNRWEQVRVEFELRSANYRAHRHPLPGAKKGRPADIIICWRHDWPECPIEVIEIASAIANKSTMRL